MNEYLDKYTIFNIITTGVFTIGVMNSNNLLILLAVLLLCWAAFQWEKHEFLNLLIATVPFQSSIRFFGINAVPVVMFALIFGKFSKRDTNVNRVGFICGSIIVFFSFLNEFSKISTWQLISWISMAIMCIIVIFETKIEKCLAEKMLLNFCVGVSFTILVNLLGMDVEGGNNTVYRFGSADTSLGGAMGIPLYVLLITSVLTVILITKKVALRQRICLGLYMVVLNVFALLSVSRAYLLGLGVIAACLFLGLFSKNWRGTIKYVLLIGAVIAIAIYLYYDDLMNIIASFQFRFEKHSNDDGRTAVWLSSLSYLQNDVHAILIGRGVYNYTIIGESLGELFSMSSHNIYIDCVMAFGIVGTVCLLSMYGNFASRCKYVFQNKPSLVSMMPFIMLSVYYMTSGSFRYQKTWIYYIMTIFFMYSYANGEVRDDT